MENEYIIYIRLIEAVDVYVPVKAVSEKLGLFTITENLYLDENDVTSIWEFFPGDTVKCSKSDKGWLAKELLESILPNRDIYKLIFTIVEHQGSIEFQDLIKTEKGSIEKLCEEDSIPQRKHPVISRWLKENCAKVFG